MAKFKFKSAVHLFLMRDAQVLMLRRYNTGYEDGNYSVVAGHLDGGETVQAAAAREALEEAGVEIDEADIEMVGVMHRIADDERIDWFVAITAWRGEVRNMEPHCCDDLSWFSLDQLPENTIPYIRKALANYQQGIWYDSFNF